MRDGGRMKDSPWDTDRDIKVMDAGNGYKAVLSFGHESRGTDMHGTDESSQMMGTLGGGIHNLKHSIDGASVTGVPTSKPPHSTKRAV